MPSPRYSPLRGLPLPLLLGAQPLRPGSSQVANGTAKQGKNSRGEFLVSLGKICDFSAEVPATPCIALPNA